MESGLEAEISKWDIASIEEMKKRGLVVTSAEGLEWRTIAKVLATP